MSGNKNYAAMTDRELLRAAEDAIHSDAVMCHSQWAQQYRDDVDAVYAECRRRSKGIYQRAWNNVVRDQGHSGMAQPVDPEGA